MTRKWICIILTMCTLLLAVIPASVSFAESYAEGVINADGVAFRKDATSDSARIQRLKKGTSVQILSLNVNAEWHKIQYKGKVGYVNRMYVDLHHSESGSCQGTVINCKTNVNVRASADTSAKLLGTVDRGAALSVTQANCKPGWHEITYNKQTGYISASYVALSQSVSASKTQLTNLTVSGGTLSPSFSPDRYGYVVSANRSEVKISVEVASGVKVKLGDSSKSSVTVSMPAHGSKTLRIALGGKVRYTIYIVRGVLTVGTWNIKRGNGNLAEMGELIAAEQPDFMGIQEAYRYPAKTGLIDNLLSLRTKHMQFTSFGQTLGYGSGGQYGVGILSAYKVASTEIKKLPSGTGEQRILQKIVVSIDGKKVSVYNTHFSYDSAAIRAQQFAEVKKTMDADVNKYKILFGDFNAKASEFSAFGKEYTVLNDNAMKFYDYSGSLISKSELDNIVVSSNITVLNVRMINENYSDHRPIFAYLSLG